VQRFFMRRHPWRLPFGPAKAVKNRSRRFFMLCHPWRLPFGPAQALAENAIVGFFVAK